MAVRRLIALGLAGLLFAGLPARVPGFEAITWFGFGAPRGTPPEIIARLNQVINAGLADPTIKARLAEVGSEPMPLSPAAFGALVATETEKWAKVVKASGAKAE